MKTSKATPTYIIIEKRFFKCKEPVIINIPIEGYTDKTSADNARQRLKHEAVEDKKDDVVGYEIVEVPVFNS